MFVPGLALDDLFSILVVACIVLAPFIAHH